MPDIEDLLLRRSSRGMDKLRPHLPPDFCRRAASSLLGLPRGKVLIATGFYVGGHAETDGPPGVYFLAKALNALGFDCTVITDRYCGGFFSLPFAGVRAESVDIDLSDSELVSLLDRYHPSALISVERCGINAEGDYANMRGVSIASHTARLDVLFEEGLRRGIPSFGIGDGGNEIGMGCLRDVIAHELKLIPCVTKVNFPIIATVSNWGAYGLCACMQRKTGLALMPSAEEAAAYLSHIVSLGAVDGTTGQNSLSVDGFPPECEAETVMLLRQACGADEFPQKSQSKQFHG